MARSSQVLTKSNVSAAVRVFRSLPNPLKWGLGIAAAVAALIYFTSLLGLFSPKPDTTVVGDGESSFTFCTWNVENLFDDRKDKRNSIDTEYDTAFAEDAELRGLKYDRIAGALLKMNDGRGPDIIVGLEVESLRAAEMLQETLNKKLADAKADDKLQYNHVAMKNLDGGRHIAPCVISRLAITPQLTRMHGRQLRILECHVNVNGHDLCIVASHWTSQLKQRDGSDGDSGRGKYAKAISDAFREASSKDPAIDFLVCGDFNDSPESEPVANELKAIGDRERVKPSATDPHLLNLMAGKDPDKFGTLFYAGRPKIYDHICVSAGMLDATGWSAEPDSVGTVTTGLTRVVATRREPFRFGNPGKDLRASDRGFSDHFPVVAKLKVAPPKE